MEFDEIEKVWRSTHNAPSAADLGAQRAELTRRLQGRYRTFLLTIGAGVTALLICVGGFVRYVLQGGAFDPTQEWGAVLLFGLPLLAAGVLLHQFRRHRAQHASYEGSISANLRAGLDENRLARARMKIIGGLYAAMALIFPLIAYQLLAVGKARPSEISSMIALFAGLILVVSVCLAYHYHRHLLPKKRELEALLGSYESGPT